MASRKNSDLEIVVVKRIYLIKREGGEEFHLELHRFLLQRVYIELTLSQGFFC